MTAIPDPDITPRAVALLGGPKVLGGKLSTPFDVHDRLEAGLPLAALTALTGAFRSAWADEAVAQILGITTRTLQRRRKSNAALTRDEASRAWKFAELFAQATEVFGDQKAAEAWFRSPARGLEGRRPLDLLDTSAGTELVETYLGQMEYGVFV